MRIAPSDAFAVRFVRPHKGRDAGGIDGWNLVNQAVRVQQIGSPARTCRSATRHVPLKQAIEFGGVGMRFARKRIHTEVSAKTIGPPLWFCDSAAAI
jgi:hypothetical protein